MVTSTVRWAGWSLLLGLAICNVARSQDAENRSTPLATVPIARLLAADEAAAMKKLQRLAASEPTRIHATTLSTHNRMGWKWRVYLPPGKDWTIKAAIGRIPGRGHQARERDTSARDISRVDPSRIIALEGHISRDPFDGWALIVEADRRVLSEVEFAAWGLHAFPDGKEVVDYVIGKRNASSLTMYSGDIGRVTTKINDELELLRWRYEPKLAPPPAGPGRRLPGFVIWIEAK